MTDLAPSGDFTTEWKKSDGPCPTCGKQSVEYMEWESSCGGHEDYKCRCTECRDEWWVEGPDA